MAKSSSRETPLYTVWCPEIGQDSSMGNSYGAIDVRRAAEIHARYNQQWEQWPKDLYVKDPDGVIWSVIVNRVMAPDFVGANPVMVVR